MFLVGHWCFLLLRHLVCVLIEESMILVVIVVCFWMQGGFVFGGSSGTFVKENMVSGGEEDTNKNYLFIFGERKNSI